MSYYDDEERITVRRGHGTPGALYERARPRRSYYEADPANFLEVARVERRRSRSQSRRRTPPSPAAQPPVIINNRIENFYDDDDDGYYQRPAPRPAPARPTSAFIEGDMKLELARREIEILRLNREAEERRLEKYEEKSRSHSRHSYSKEDFELDQAKRELQAIKEEARRKEAEKIAREKKEYEEYKAKVEREEEEKRVKREMEIKRLEAEKKAAQEAKEREEAKKAAIEEYKIKEAERVAKEKKEKERFEREYKHRLEDDLRKSGVDERQIQAILRGDKSPPPHMPSKALAPISRPTYTRMARKYLSIETLNQFRIDYEFDANPEYILIKRWVNEDEQDMLWAHTREIRERRAGGGVLLIEDRKPHTHRDVEFEIVREKKHKRKPSPSPLITFLAGRR